MAALRELPAGRPGDGPCVIGAHVEGPFISPRRLGVHPRGMAAVAPTLRCSSACSTPAA